MKKKQILAYILCLAMLLSFVPQAFAAGDGSIKNIIYMIPDGGGMVPFYLANDLKKAGGWDRNVYPYSTDTDDGEMYILQYLVGGLTTRSANSPVTDSAAGGTALSSGYKTNNYHVGIDPQKKPHASILEAAQYVGKKTGMVTIYEWTNATPAAFSAHAPDRTDYADMSEQIVNQGIDVVLGGGFGAAKWGSIKEAEVRGYNIIDTKEKLANVKAGDKIWGNLVSDSFPYDIHNDETTPTLAEMTKAAITALDSGDNGFFLMVEGSRVDGGGHNNYALGMVSDFLAFDAACKVAIEYAKGRNDTLVVICPDHDTGGMNTPANTNSTVQMLKQGKEPTDVTWETDGHTARNGGLFVYVPAGVAYPRGITGDLIGTNGAYETYVIDNTELAPYMAGFMGVNLDDISSKLFVDVTDLGRYSSDTGMFIFNSDEYSVMAKSNTSSATIDGEEVSLNGQVILHINNRFYVPQILLDRIGYEAPSPDEVKVIVNGEKVVFDVKPIIEEGRVLVPVRAIFEKLGASVTWDGNTRTVFSEMGDRKVSMVIDDASVNVNGEKRVIDVPARIIDGRTLVPVRAVSESYNCNVAWDGDTRTVTIN